MWKIKIVYADGSKLDLTGKHKEIPIDLAVKYYNMYVAGNVLKKSVYQQYPVKYNDEQDLYEYILENSDEESE